MVDCPMTRGRCWVRHILQNVVSPPRLFPHTSYLYLDVLPSSDSVIATPGGENNLKIEDPGADAVQQAWAGVFSTDFIIFSITFNTLSLYTPYTRTTASQLYRSTLEQPPNE